MKNCIMLWKNDAVDLAINNQRRAFSDAYNNEVPASAELSRLLADCSVSESKAILKMAENLKEILRSQK